MPQTLNTMISGLQVRGKSYFLRKMVNGIHIQKTIGRVADMELQDAEKQCIDLIAKVRDQGEFALQMAEIRGKAGLPLAGSNRASTLREIANEMVAHGKLHGTPKTKHRPWKRSSVELWEGWIASERMKPLVDQPISNVAPQDIEDWYVADLQKGKRTATDNAFRMLRRLCNWAEGQGLISLDPTRRMALNPRRYTPQRRDVRLDNTSGEIGRFALALTQYEPAQVKHTNDTVLHCVLFSMLTGRRTDKIKNMEWSWVDFDRRLITIPGEAVPENDPFSKFQGTKNRQDFVVPMARIIQTMLRIRAENKINERFVFPQRNRKGPLQDFRVTQGHLISLAKVKRITPHDFRRTFADIARVVRPDHFTVQDVVGHKVHDVTATYLSGLTLVERRQVFQAVSDYVSRAMPVRDITVDGKEFLFSGQVDLDEDNVTERDERIFHPDAMELLMFPRIWRNGEWADHDGLDDALPTLMQPDDRAKAYDDGYDFEPVPDGYVREGN